MKYEKPSKKLIEMRNKLKKDINADNEDWAELVKELIPYHLRQEWSDWIRNNINNCINEGIENQSELLILSFLHSIYKDEPLPPSQSIPDENQRKFSQVEVRWGQGDFANNVSINCYKKCVVTECSIPSRLQAAHIIPHTDQVDYSVSNGLLLRADIHQMFDRGDCAIEPTTKKIFFIDRLLKMDSDITPLHGKVITAFIQDINWSSLSTRWSEFEKKRYS
ncbi:HNH endonuclease signature motif containing protein [Serratia sp. K-E0102]|uniref:HNH endonuclease signature motif containing protein n=1 Tax=Serratia TaxID=613 RepID=UPI0007455AD0|nr:MULTISPECIES: HNH endonuclease signature motif containing protein [Serratia]WGZ69755.1 HNH endonuclease signature motif containing protein [Serratia sp. K-E0102]CUZ49198.1 Uncharacterised protein [Serratia marcescens]